LMDGSRVILAAGGRVEVDNQTSERIQLSQQAGKVRYLVAKNKPRAFVVKARGVTVRVIGTVFSVDILENDNVRVDVEEGRVSVDDGTRKLDLRGGEQMRVKAGPRIAQIDAAPPQPTGANDVNVDRLAPAVPQPEKRKVRRRTRRRARKKSVQPQVEKKPAPRRVLAYTPSSSFRNIPHIGDQLARLDSARQAGQLAEAAAILRAIIRDHKQDPRLVTAWFLLGRIESNRNQHVLAARAFGTCLARAPHGPLAEDALAGEATAWAAAGERERARILARLYMDAYSSGTHLKKMEALAR